MPEEYWTQKVRAMPLAQQQARYRELTRKVADMVLLTKEEFSEMIALRDALQDKAKRDNQAAQE
jgi:hypothetical protein